MESRPPRLCAHCSAIMSSPANVKQLFSIQGYKHHKRGALKFFASRRCSLCKTLFEGTEGYAHRSRSAQLQLYGWRDDGEGDVATPIQRTCMDTYIDVRIADETGSTMCIFAAEGRWISFGLISRSSLTHVERTRRHSM